jgi:acetyltransferase-like isoleucine patch superfamily enzyme
MWLFKWIIVRISGIDIALSARISHRAHFEKQGGKIIIGDRATINDYVKIIAQGNTIEIGTDVSINYNSILYGHGGLTIGDNTRIAAHCMFIPMNHNYDDLNILIKDQGITKKGIVIGSDVWIGARVTVLDGVIIGNGVVVGAGSLVCKNLSPNGVYVGNPAHLIKYRGKK